ncbi:MAG: TRL-like family protein [Elusimicrobia bacterium]|nr:TRL-like family protein [Candidatus Liberimonas magnetica]
MKKVLCAILLLSVAAFFTGCATVSSPLAGMIYTDVKAPGPVSNASGSSKVGKATATSILGLFAMGDASIKTAAQSAGIKIIQHVDYYSTSILGLYSTFTVEVYGE